MQKRANRILSMLLALIMVMTMLPATVFANSETDVFAGWSLTLGEDIGVNFYLAEEAANYTVDVTVAGNKAAYTTATKDGYYVVSVNVAAAQMTDVITLNVKNGDTQVHIGEYSVRQYAEKILTGAYDAEVKELVKQMLNLGAAAQTYFAYNTDPLANKGYEIDTPAAVPTEVPAIALEDNLDGVSLYGMSLLFQSKTAVRFYFVVDGDVANYTFKVGGEAWEVKNSEDLYYVEIGDINPQDLGNEITVTVNDALSVSYNPLTYIVRKYNSDSSSAALKNLVQAMYGYHLAAKKYASIIWAGTMGSHSNGWNENALYFSMAENAAPVGDAIRYKPEAASNLKLIRDGVTYDVGHTARETIVKSSDTGYYIALWVLGDYKPLVANDILVVEGNFTNAANNTTMNISKSYVLINADGTASFSTEMPTLTTVIDAGTMSAHSTTGWKSSAEAAGNLLFAMADNDAPSGYYRPTDASNVQLIRGGNTYVVGHNLRDTISKENNAQYVFEFWTIADHKPMVANDILVVEGDFYQESTKTMLNISKTYILLNADGTASFSTEMPTLPTVIDAGVMGSHSNGWNADALYFSMAENEAPSGDAIRYTPEAASNLKLIRDGVTYDVGHTARETIVKSSDTGYYIALWVLGDYKPLVANDILVVEGNFTNAENNTTLNISKSYVLINADGTASFSTEMPTLQTIVDAGAMSGHEDGSASEIYFSLSENAVPVDENAETAYTGSVQLVRSGAVSTVSANIYKLDEGYYYLELDGVELADGDYLVVEGAFSNANNGYTMNITKTYVLADGDTLVYSDKEPVLSTAIDAGVMSKHSVNGWASNGVYASMAENAAPFDGWSVEYSPVASENLKLIRGGQTYNIGFPGRGTLVKYNATDYFLKMEWNVGEYAPMQDGDVLIVEGGFVNAASNTTLNISKTYIYADGNNVFFNPILAGAMSNHANGVSGDGIYASMAENAAPYDEWKIEYTPVTADSYYVIRNGEQINIGIPGRGTLVKYGDTNYFLKINSWCTNNFAYTTDDIIVVDGFWRQNTQGSAIMKIEKTYLYYNGSAWTFATELPSVISGGTMQTHTKGMWGNGISFTMAANNAPFNSDWTLEYNQTSTDNIKIIRGGETISIGIVDRPLIIKISNDEYYLKLEGWTIGNYGLNSTSPITTDDVIIVEGNFVYENVTLNVTKSYVYYNGSAWVCSAEAPVQKNIVDVVELGSHSNGWTTGGFYFTAAANDAPLNTDWSLRYKPLSADAIKCISGDTTTNVGNTGAETIVKYSETGYYIEGWAIGGSANLVAGNTFVIDGQFYNAANNVYINVEKTYITLNAGGTITVVNKFVDNEADTEFGKVVLPTSNKNMTIGMWNGSYHVFEHKQLQELQAAGITKIMGIDTQWIGTTDVNAWLDRVYGYGISVIMDLRSWDGETVPSYASHPGVLGFLMYDEPCATEFDNLADLKAKFDAVMPADKLFYVNLFPSCAAGTSLVGALDWALGRRDYDTYYVQKFLDKLDVEVLSWDNYSLITQTNDTSVKGIRTDYFYNFEVMASKTAEKWYTMLSSGHGTTAASYAIPTAEELRWQMAVAMTYGVQNIDHYTYVSHEDDYSCMVEFNTWKPTDLYYDILQVDNEYLAWDNIFMAYNWKGVAGVKAGSSSRMLDMLENNIDLRANGLASVSTTQDVLVGVFDYNGDKAYMVTNAGSAGSNTVGDGKNFTMTDATVTLNLADGNYKCAAIIDQGEITYVAVNNNQIVLDVEAYEGVFVIPVLN